MIIGTIMAVFMLVVAWHYTLSIKMTCRFGLQGLSMQPPCPPPLTVTYIEFHSPK